MGSDFGLSVLREAEETGLPGRTKHKFPFRRAPMEWHCFSEFTTMSDVFMFGLMLWELIHNQVPFSALQQDDVLVGLTKGELRPCWEIKIGAGLKEIEALFDACLQSEQKKRPSMRRACSVLESAHAQAGIWEGDSDVLTRSWTA